MSDKRIQETVYVKPDLHEFLQQQAIKEEVSFSEMCNIAFSVFVENEKELSKMFKEVEEANEKHIQHTNRVKQGLNAMYGKMSARVENE